MIRSVSLLMISAAVLGVSLSAPDAALSHETLSTTVLFDREIVRILDKHCVMCHVDNGPSFPLETYEQTWLRGRSIRAEVLKRHMPPWPAAPGYGHFVNDNGLTLRETQFIISWVEGLGPRNAGTVFTNVVDVAAKPRERVRAHSDFGFWHLGEPDFKLELPPHAIEANAVNSVKRTVVDLGLRTARHIRGLEFMPGDRRVVRAAFFTVQETGQWIGSWTPWYGFVDLPDDSTIPLPAGSRIVAEVHYRGASGRVVERSSLGLYFAGRAARNIVSDLVLEAKGTVAAGGARQRFRAENVIGMDMHALALRTEISPGAQSVEVSTRRPDGGTEVLLFAKDLDPNWPTPFIFREPVLLQRGSRLSVTAYYANPGAASQPGGIRLTVSRTAAR